MSRIDVIAGERNKFRVLVNFGGVAAFEYSSPSLANNEAKKLQDKYPDAVLHLFKPKTATV